MKLCDHLSLDGIRCTAPAVHHGLNSGWCVEHRRRHPIRDVDIVERSESPNRPV